MARERARQKHEKQEKVALMVEAAGRALDRKGWRDLTMADVAREAGVAKATLFLYFPTREALFLLLLQQYLFDFFDDLSDGLREGRARWSPQPAARALAGLLDKHDRMTRLLALLHPVLEANVDDGQVIEFRAFLLSKCGDAGGALEDRMPFLPPGEGAYLMLRLFALVSGLRQMTEPSALLRELARHPVLGRLNIDYRTELTHCVSALITGMAARPSARR